MAPKTTDEKIKIAVNKIYDILLRKGLIRMEEHKELTGDEE